MIEFLHHFLYLSTSWSFPTIQSIAPLLCTVSIYEIFHMHLWT